MVNVLMVVTSETRFPNGGPQGGAWLEELAGPYYTFFDAGCHVEIASPKGGEARLDPMSLEPPWLLPDGERFLKDAEALHQLAESWKLAEIKATELDAIFLVGGALAAFDFPDNTHLVSLIQKVLNLGKPVAAVCHGVLGLLNVQDSHGGILVQGKKLTAVSNAEERLAGFYDIVPLLPEDAFKQAGAEYSCAGPLECHVVQDGQLITGQNPASARPAAVCLLEACS